MKVALTLRIDLHIVDILDKYCKKEGLNRSAIMRLALAKLLKERGVM